MFCPNCGTENNTGQYCSNCGKALNQQNQKFSNYNDAHINPNNLSGEEMTQYLRLSSKTNTAMVLSIISIAIGSKILGIIAIFMVNTAKNNLSLGKYAECESSCKSANILAAIGLALPVVIVVIYIMFAIFSIGFLN